MRSASAAAARPAALRERHLLLAVGLLLATLALDAFVSTRALATLRQHHAAATRSHEVLTTATAALAAAQDVQTGQRGYTLTGEEAFLDPYRSGRGRLGPLLDRLALLTAGDARQRAHLDALRRTTGQLLDEMALVVAIRQGEGPEAAGARIRSGRGRAAMNAVRRVTATMHHRERQRLATIDAAVRASGRAASLTFVAVSAAAFLLILAVAVALRRALRLRLAQDEELRALNASLEDRVTERTASLAARSEELEAATRLLRDSEERLRLLHAVTAPSGEPFADRIRRALSLTTTLLDLQLGVLARVEGDAYTVLACHDPEGGLQPGDTLVLRDTYCSIALEQRDLLAIDHMGASPYRTRSCYAQHGLEAYIGVPVQVWGGTYGILCFSSPRPHAFTEADRDLLRLLALWVGGALEEEAKERALAESEARLRVLSEGTFEGLFFTRGDVLLDANEQGARLFGYDLASEMAGLSASALVAPEHLARVRTMMIEGRADVYEAACVRRDGSRFWAEVQGHVVPFFDGQPARLTAIRDVSRRKEAEAQTRFQADVLAQVREAVIALDLDGRVTYWNGGAEWLHGLPAEEAVGRPIADVVHYRWVDRAARRGAAQAFEQGFPWTGDLVYDDPEGGRRYVAVTTSVLRDEAGHETGMLAVVRDVSAEREMQGRLEHQATHDALTALPNRTRFEERTRHAAARFAADPARPFAVLLVDLDGFKVVNDSLGHAAGDTLLTAVARRMRGAVRTRDVVARLGGDEFGVLLDLADGRDPAAVARGLLEALGAPLQLGPQSVRPGASVGLVVSDARYAALDATLDAAGALIRDADTAMYTAKRGGRGRVAAFDPAMHGEAERRFRLGADLREAIARGELCAHYQPVVELATGRVAGFEALVRWQHPEHGLLFPDQFLPLAEEDGLVAEIDGWMVEEAARQFGAWREALDAAPLLLLNVNCSAAAYLAEGYVPRVLAAARAAGLPLHHLHLELTERALFDVGGGAAEVTEALRAQGVHLCVDDFGTGFSSLDLLAALPLDTLKVDRSFVAALDATPETATGSPSGEARRRQAIVHALLRLSGELGLSVVAEGVETPAQLEVLRGLDCPFAQGYLFSRPLPPDAAERILREGPPWLGLWAPPAPTR